MANHNPKLKVITKKEKEMTYMVREKALEEIQMQADL